ncbi:MAG: hypothetical protein HY244_11770 [Rhizobiales bacterium]|nr:hypothetical protein [Hyphomicrobiales bacterium]
MRWVVLLAVLVLGGCASDIGPSPAELRQQWEAQNIVPAAYKADLIAFMRTYLNDPRQVRGATVSQPQRKTVGRGERYVVCLRYTEGRNAGQREGVATFVSGKLDRYFDVTKGKLDRSIDLPVEAGELCKDAVFAPFPELEKLTR